MNDVVGNTTISFSSVSEVIPVRFGGINLKVLLRLVSESPFIC